MARDSTTNRLRSNRNTDRLITLDNKFQNIFVSVMNMLLIYLFASLKLENGHKNYLALVLKLRYTVIFYEMG